jgi:RNA polymerase sigma-70 factor (ECF subfamily)
MRQSGPSIAAAVVKLDSDPVEGCRRGDAAAQRRLFQIYKDRVYAMALLLCRDAADADEVTQDAFVKVFLNVHRFRGEAKFDTWLYQIVANTARDHRKARGRRLLLESVFWLHHASTPSRVDDRRDRNDAVRAAVRSLPDVLRQCVVLRYGRDLSYDEIAAALNCPVGTVGARLSRAHRLLARKLGRTKESR